MQVGIIILGYVLDGFPSLCEDWLTMKEQLELIKNWKYKPDFIINLKVKSTKMSFILELRALESFAFLFGMSSY